MEVEFHYSKKKSYPVPRDNWSTGSKHLLIGLVFALRKQVLQAQEVGRCRIQRKKLTVCASVIMRLAFSLQAVVFFQKEQLCTHIFVSIFPPVPFCSVSSCWFLHGGVWGVVQPQELEQLSALTPHWQIRLSDELRQMLLKERWNFIATGKGKDETLPLGCCS